ncbi:AAA family ATPase, partial [candidate division KSB1 bacterium]|nr:AAA family ATPase [candidate division KSB1 bacterium]
MSRAKTIGILSIKGGVGKTSTVAALGAAIAGFDKKVLLIDGNFSAPNLGLHLGIVNPKVT